MNNRERPIGVFDSGVGGISVLREMVALMPNENFIYFGDSKNAPYGTKPISEVQDLTISIAEKLVEMGVKAIVVACNTATSVGVEILRAKYPDIPVVGVEPALKPAVLYKKNPQVLVMATDITIREKKFRELLEKYAALGEIHLLPCPGLMEWVEKGIIEDEELTAFVKDLLAPYAGKTDSVVLGCTHYPFLADTIKKVMGDNVRLFDGGAGTARELLRRLAEAEITNDEENVGKVTFLSSNNCEAEIELCKALLYMKKEVDKRG